MLYRMTELPGSWSRGGKIAAVLVAGEIALAWALTIEPRHAGVAAALTGAALAIGSVIVVARCQIPGPLKAALILAVAGTILTWIATQDALGLKGLRASTATTLNDAAAHAADRVHVRLPAGATAADERMADDVATALGGALADADVSVAVTLAPATPGDRTYRIGWAVERGADHRWCGDVSGADPDDADFTLLADRVAAAARRSLGGALACA